MPDASNKGASPAGPETPGLRRAEAAAAAQAGRDYKDTLFLPATDFPMRAGLPKREPDFLKRWEALGLYERLRADAQSRKPYVLHDGPPYANGHVHCGTAMNKILKDIVVRSRQMAGFNANYVPGWDCHGLPIEWKVEEEFRAKGRDKRDIPSAEFRAACRAYAEKWLDIQREEFKRLGGAGDWGDPYTTMAYGAEAAIVAEFLKFVEQGLVYRGSKPVMWSPVEQTALAEAEIEYHDHVSTTVWVKFPVKKEFLPRLRGRSGEAGEGVRRSHEASTPEKPPSAASRPLPPQAGEEDPAGASIVIWTTTPWTIPGNRAICYSEKIAYGLYEVTALAEAEFEPWARVGEKLIVAKKLAADVFAAAKIADAKLLQDVKASDLGGYRCDHPLNGFRGGYNFSVPLLAGDHVTDEDGTGFVHTAPGHGAEDYLAWMAPEAKPWRDALVKLEGKEIPHTVDEFGRFTDEAPGFTGAQIIVTEGKKKGKDGDANKAVIDALVERGALLARGRLTHSYPHSWRSKAPVIFRNTPQWFIKLGAVGEGGLRDTALKAIDATAFTPPSGKNRIRSMVETRPDWLVSRQRAWGVPLTIFVHKETGDILNDPEVNSRIVEAVTARGADAWFDTPAQEILGEDYSADDYEKIEDILDVWFDSGSTHAFTLEGRDDLKWPADLYLEGSDQHRGWFQSSLLESCGTRGRAPYDAVLTHGFVLDENGRKMSKSLGNTIDPADLIRQYGAEILRIWTASSDYAEDLRIGDEILGSAVDAYRKLRNTLRYLLGALNGFSEDERVAHADMPELERYVLHLLARLDARVREAYEKFDFKTVWRRVHDFCAIDLSSLYLDVRKDSLYCDRPIDLRRRAARTVMDLVFERVTVWLAPICVFTMEEAWLARFPSEDGSVHLRQFPETPSGWRDDALGEKWTKVRRVRRAVTGALEIERREKRIGASLEAAPVIYLSDDTLRAACDGLDLAELCITSSARLEAGEGPAEAQRFEEAPGVAVVPAKTEDIKCVRCWRYLPDVGTLKAHPELCGRCADAVGAHDARAGGASA
ncbi:MAG: isoleucine--tRNA ligase [Parvularculaceae bacterium]